MIESTASTQRSDESRLELAIAASAAERANKPRWIIVLGALLLIATGIYALTEVSARAAMISKISGEWAQAKKVQDLKNNIETETITLARRGTAPDLRAGQKIEAYALQSQITLMGAVTDSTRAANSAIGMQMHVYTARGLNQDPLAIFNWLQALQAAYDSSGLEITRLRLAPGTPTPQGGSGWNVDVEFARWEKLPGR